jgi:hypothetical protein
VAWKESSEFLKFLLFAGRFLSLTSDVANGFIYWSQGNYQPNSYNGIYKIRQDGTEMTPIIDKGLGTHGILSISLDWVTGKLFNPLP